MADCGRRGDIADRLIKWLHSIWKGAS